MAAALVELVGSDIRFSCGGFAETRQPAAQAIPQLRGWSDRYDRAAASNDENALLEIGREMFDWLDKHGVGPTWVGGTGDRELVIAIDGQGDELEEAALVDAPWELLATEDGPLVADDMRLFVTSRRVATDETPCEPAFCDLRLMFMAASPNGMVELDYEAEEAAILNATKSGERVQLLVEETGSLDFLADRLASDEGPFEVLHLSCHGDIHQVHGPVLMLETAAGEPNPVGPGKLFEALPSKDQPLLVALSACRTAELRQSPGSSVGPSGALKDDAFRLDADTARVAGGVKFTASYARRLATQVANVLAWDGSVYDHDATSFAETFYKLLGRGETVPRAAAKARRQLLEDKMSNPKKGRHWHLARVYLGPGGGGQICERRRPWHERLPADGDMAMLDKNNNRVPVAARRAFVGRRRSIQSVLRAFRDGQGLGRAVLVQGNGGVGKSSLAARVVGRATASTTVVIFERYDALSVFDTVLKAVSADPRKTLEERWRAKIKDEETILATALEALLEGPLDDNPILLIVDDLERILEKPLPGQVLTGVQGEDYRTALGSILRAFAKARTASRLLLTSRYDFQLHDEQGVDLAASLTRVALGKMPDSERKKQFRRAVAVAGGSRWRSLTSGRGRCSTVQCGRQMAIRGFRRL